VSLKKRESRITAVVLAAGYATRLYPLTKDIPKPLLRVTGTKTVVDFIVDDLEAYGVREIVVVTNRKFYPVFRTWARARRGRVPVVVLDDGTLSNEDRRGAVGDLDFAVRRRRIKTDIVVVGGDNLFDRGCAAFLEFAERASETASLGVVDIGRLEEARRFGVVKLDKGHRVVSFEEKPARPQSTLVATCLYYLPKRVLALLARYMADPSTSKDAPGNFIRWLMIHDRVMGGCLARGHWFDIGHLNSYKKVVALYNGSA
jgi:glucose-1-phosphate thymidylyltransferase